MLKGSLDIFLSLLGSSVGTGSYPCSHCYVGLAHGIFRNSLLFGSRIVQVDLELAGWTLKLLTPLPLLELQVYITASLFASLCAWWALSGELT